MTAKLAQELASTLQLAGTAGLQVVDPERNRVNPNVDEGTHRTAMDALRSHQDQAAIAEGIAQMEAGQGRLAGHAF